MLQKYNALNVPEIKYYYEKKYNNSNNNIQNMKYKWNNSNFIQLSSEIFRKIISIEIF